MKKSSFKFLAFIIVSLLIFQLKPQISSAASTSDGYTYIVSGTEVIITGYTGSGGNITIPATIDGYPVTIIGNSAIYNCASLTSVIIPNSVVNIGGYAFANCTNLISVTIPDGVKSIEHNAFYNCTNLVSVTIPNSVNSIGEGAFSGCDSLTSIIIPNSVTDLSSEVFYNCNSLTSITIPDSVTSIGASTFANCASLKSVDIGSSVTRIGESAFANCVSLTSIIIPNSVTNLNGGVFYNCNSLTSITIPDSVTSIGVSTFANCTSLTSVIIPNSVTNIGENAFNNCTSLKNVIISDSVPNIGNYTFYNCTNLTSVTIGSNVTSIGGLAFGFCTSLTSVTIPDSVTNIDFQAFYICTKLITINVNSKNTVYSSVNGILYDKLQTTLICCPAGKVGSVAIPNSVTSIGNQAFCYCTNLSILTIPDSVTSIGYSAFYYCIGLREIKFFGDAPTMGTSLFAGGFASPLKIYYLADKTGFPPTLEGYSVEPFYIVTYDGNGNTSGSVPVDSTKYLQGANVTVSDNIGFLAKAGYTFVGWNTQVEANGTDYVVGATLSIGIDNVTLYARWIVKPDITPPQLSIEPKGGIYNSDKNIVITPSEEADIYYTLDGGNPSENSEKYSNSLLVYKNTILKVMAIDKVGNKSEIYTENFVIDKVKPSSSISLNGHLGDNGWYKSDVLVTLSSEDNLEGSGIAKTSYSLDGVGWSLYIEPLIISTEGVTRLYYKTTDKAGNEEVANIKEIDIDKMAPVISSSIKDKYLAGDTLKVSFDASDELSGVAFKYAMFNATKYPFDADIKLDKAGRYTLELIAEDKAGNIEKTPISITVSEKSLPTTLSFSYFNMTGNPVTLNGATDSVLDSAGNLYITDYNNNRVVVFDAAGKFIRAYGSQGNGLGKLYKPSGIAIDAEDYLYVADTYNNRIVRFKDKNNSGTIEAEEWQVWGGAVGSGTLQFNKPMGVYVKGTKVYVADTYNYRIAMFDSTDASGTWKAFGIKGTANGQFNLPYDIVADSQDNIIVSDTFNNRVQKLNKDGAYIAHYAASYPYGLSVDNSDNIFVAERMTGYIKCVNAAKTYGGKGSTAGLFTSPLGVNIDAKGRLWIVDVTANKVQYEDTIKISDMILEKTIRDAISKPIGDITKGDLEGVKYLVAESKGIKNLEGIQYCRNLKVLGLYDNEITDITWLKDLTNLENLVLCSNDVEDITALKGLANLTWLSLQDNRIIDIEALKYLTHLTVLDIQENNIEDIKPLENLTKLTTLYLGYNPVNDFTFTLGYYNNLIKRDFNLDGSPYHRVMIIHSCYPYTNVQSESKTLTVIYPDIAVKKEYSLDGETWYPYTEPIVLMKNAYVYTRAFDADGNEYTGGVEIRNIVPST